MNWTKIGFIVSFLLLSGFACKIYNFKGSNIPKELKTFSVEFFSNEAQIVNPQLSLQFTEKLKTKFQTESKLSIVTQDGDYRFSGAIKEYKVSPATINSTSGTAQNQFSITVKVVFECPAYPEKNFNKDFTFFRTFDAGKDFSTVEPALSGEITDNIIQQIFAATALDW